MSISFSFPEFSEGTPCFGDVSLQIWNATMCKKWIWFSKVKQYHGIPWLSILAQAQKVWFPVTPTLLVVGGQPTHKSNIGGVTFKQVTVRELRFLGPPKNMSKGTQNKDVDM